MLFVWWAYYECDPPCVIRKVKMEKENTKVEENGAEEPVKEENEIEEKEKKVEEIEQKSQEVQEHIEDSTPEESDNLKELDDFKSEVKKEIDGLKILLKDLKEGLTQMSVSGGQAIHEDDENISMDDAENVDPYTSNYRAKNIDDLDLN